MSRSRRHTPIVGMCGTGAGAYRRIRAGQERARARGLIARGEAEDADVELAPWNEWHTHRDGKLWVGDHGSGKKWWLVEWPNPMRK